LLEHFSAGCQGAYETDIDTRGRGGIVAEVNRGRFVNVVWVLVGLLVTALIMMMILLPDRLSRVAEIFLR
jgi:hypothetical protein